MGYYVRITSNNFMIPAENLDAALTVLKALNTDPAHDEMKNHDSSGAHYSWMTPNYHETVTSAEEVFKMLGFETESNEHGLTLVHYDDKTGKEQYFLAAVAHLVTPESYIEWTGDDGELWRLDFDGKTMTERVGQIVFV